MYSCLPGEGFEPSTAQVMSLASYHCLHPGIKTGKRWKDSFDLPIELSPVHKAPGPGLEPGTHRLQVYCYVIFPAPRKLRIKKNEEKYRKITGFTATNALPTELFILKINRESNPGPHVFKCNLPGTSLKNYLFIPVIYNYLSLNVHKKSPA